MDEEIKLDLKDRKLLYELDTNSRQSSHKLAKKIGISKDSIIYRIKRLQKIGIIKNFHTVIDTGKLGLIPFRLYIKLQNTTPEIEKQIIDFLIKQKQISWVVSIDGEYNIGSWILTETIKEMNILWKTLNQRFTNFIEKKQLTIFTKIYYYSRKYLLENAKDIKEYNFITESEKIKTDEKDKQILKLLSDNSRISILEISEKTKLTPKTVSQRIKDLEKKEVIIGYRTMFDIEKLGYQYFKLNFNLQNTNKEKLKKLNEFFKSHPNIIYINEVLGGDDIELDVQVKSLNKLREVINQIKNQFSAIIRDYKYMHFYKEHKYIFMVE